MIFTILGLLLLLAYLYGDFFITKNRCTDVQLSLLTVLSGVVGVLFLILGAFV